MLSRRQPTQIILALLVALLAAACAAPQPTLPTARMALHPNDLSGPTHTTDILALSDDDYNLAAAEMAVEFAAGEDDDPNARARWFWEQRALPLETIPVDVHRAAVDAELVNVNRAAGVWQELGPDPLNDITYAGQSAQDASGRALTIAIKPDAANTMLLGAAQGGIWRTTNGGTSWAPVSDNMPSLAIKVIRFAPSNPDIVYAGTGEPHGSTSIYGRGVLKSTDGGLTWSALPLVGAGWDFQNIAVSGLQVHPTNPSIVYITTANITTFVNHFQPPDTPPPGIYKSTNGGTSWTLQKAATEYIAFPSSFQGNLGFMDLELQQSSPNTLYAAEYFGGIWKTTNGGTSWTLITPVKAGGYATFPAPVTYFAIQDPNTLGYTRQNATFYNTAVDFTRIELALSQSTPGLLYAGYAAPQLPYDPNNDGSYFDFKTVATGLLFKTHNGGTTWNWLGDILDGVPNYCANQCEYDNMVEVNPTNGNDLVIGGSANYSQYIPDPLVAPTSYYEKGWSGMVHRSLDGGDTFFDLSYHCTSNGPPNPANFNIRPCLTYAANKVTHPDIHGAAYHPTVANRIFIANDGGLYRVAASGNAAVPTNYTWTNLNSGLATLQFYYFDIHPTNANIMLGGLQDNAAAYWDGSSWEGWAFGDGIFGAFDPVSPNYVYMGTQFNVHRHDAGGAKVALTAAGQPANGWNLSIYSSDLFQVPFEIAPANTSTLYAGRACCVVRSTNRGGSWSNYIFLQGQHGTPTTITSSPVDVRRTYAGTRNGALYLRDDIDITSGWFEGGVLPPRYVTKVEASPSNSGAFYATYSGYDANTPATPGKVFKLTRSPTLGWNNTTITNLTGNLPDVPVSAFAIDPDNEQRMWVGTDTAVYGTTNGGLTWESLRGNMPVVGIMDLKYDSARDALWVVTHGRGAWRMSAASVPTAVDLNQLATAAPTDSLLLVAALVAVALFATAVTLRRRADLTNL